MRRLLFLDFLRGFFILYVVFVHSAANIVFNSDPGAADNVNPVLLIILFPFVLLGSWAPIFTFISGTANAYVMASLMEKDPSNENLKKLIKGMLINSVFILVLSYMNMALFHPHFIWNGQFQTTLLTGYFETGSVIFYPQLLFYNDAMHIIGMAGIVLSITLYFLWRNGGFANKARNNSILNRIALGILIISPLLNSSLIDIFYQFLDEGNWAGAFFLKLIMGPRQSTFPNAAMALFGAVFGCLLANNAPFKEIKQFGYSYGILFIVIDLLFLIPRDGITIQNFLQNDLPMSVYLLNFGLQMILATWLIGFMEYQTTKRRRLIAKRTVAIRRFGLMALTVYLLEGMISNILALIFIPLWGPDFDFSTNVLAIIIFLILILVIWDIILRLWEKKDFKYTFEWWIVNIVGRLRGRKSSRLKVDQVLYNPVCMPSEILENTVLSLLPSEELDLTEIEYLAMKLRHAKESLKDVVGMIKGLSSKIKKAVISGVQKDLKQTGEDLKIEAEESSEIVPTEDTPTEDSPKENPTTEDPTKSA
jgi:Acyltransferase family